MDQLETPKFTSQQTLFDLDLSDESSIEPLGDFKDNIMSTLRKMVPSPSDLSEITEAGVSGEKDEEAVPSFTPVIPCFHPLVSMINLAMQANTPTPLEQTNETQLSQNNIPCIQHFNVKWSNHELKICSFVRSQDNMAATADLIITAREGTKIYAHRMVLAAASPFFKHLLEDLNSEETVVLVLTKPARYLRPIISFCYSGALASPTDMHALFCIGDEFEMVGINALKQQYYLQKSNPWSIVSDLSSHASQPSTSFPINYKRNWATVDDEQTFSTEVSEQTRNIADENVYAEKLAPIQTHSNSGNRVLLWKFLLNLLHDSHLSYHIKWVDRKKGVFRILGSDHIAQLWGDIRKNKYMTYEKMSRGMRTYYKRGILSHLDGTKLIYRFSLENPEVQKQMEMYDKSYGNGNKVANETETSS